MGGKDRRHELIRGMDLPRIFEPTYGVCPSLTCLGKGYTGRLKMGVRLASKAIPQTFSLGAGLRNGSSFLPRGAPQPAQT